MTCHFYTTSFMQLCVTQKTLQNSARIQTLRKGGERGQSSRPLDKWWARSPLRAPPLDPPLQK